MILTHCVVRAAKYNFIVPLYLLGAAYGSRDYVSSLTPQLQSGAKTQSSYVYTKYSQHYNIVELETKAQVTQ